MLKWYVRRSEEPRPDHKSIRRCNVDKWECTICGYVYDPAQGDPNADISPGTAFEDLPDDWVCPDCGADKAMFEKVES